MNPLPDFKNIEYLKSGSPIQRIGYSILIESKILYHLKSFGPVLTGTLPLDLFIEGKSDLDIICQSADLLTVEKILLNRYGKQPRFSIDHKEIRQIHSLICRFVFKDFPFEIFCQPLPVAQQHGYRHMVVEYKLLLQHGENFRNEILRLKKQNIKTEPAFARLLGLEGDPYDALLNLEK
jgi:hypothetical protein